MAGWNFSSTKRSVVDHILAVAFAVLFYFVLPPAAVLFLSILTLACFVASLAVPQ
jgi:hypothetical protein